MTTLLNHWWAFKNPTNPLGGFAPPGLTFPVSDSQRQWEIVTPSRLPPCPLVPVWGLRRSRCQTQGCRVTKHHPISGYCHIHRCLPSQYDRENKFEEELLFYFILYNTIYLHIMQYIHVNNDKIIKNIMETYSVLYIRLNIWHKIYEIKKNGQETVMVTIEKPPLYK